MAFPWGVHERQGDVTYVEVPEYQPSSAKLTLGGPQIYQTSQRTQPVSVGRIGLDAATIVLIAIPVSLFIIWLWRRK